LGRAVILPEKEVISLRKKCKRTRNCCTDDRFPCSYSGGVIKAEKKSSRSFATIAPKNILIPIDFSVASKNALRHALGLASAAARIILLHVIAPSAENRSDAASLTDAAKRNLQSFVRKAARGCDRSIRSLVRTGTPFQEILATAKENRVGLIVLAVDDSAPFGGLALGHTVERVSRYAPCPILLVRQEEGDQASAKVPGATASS
jgi:nucleotide-binding universal stress UspA family protein